MYTDNYSIPSQLNECRRFISDNNHLLVGDRYVDPDTGFISEKSKDGKALKAQELPGLWNGSMSDWMGGLEAVLPTGQWVRAGVKTRKGVVGYDLAQLLIGSEGTLAIITEATAL